MKLKRIIDTVLDKKFIQYNEDFTERIYYARVLYKDGTDGYEYITKPMPQTVYESEVNYE